MIRIPAVILALSATLIYLGVLVALLVKHLLDALPSPDPLVSVPISSYLTPLCILASVAPTVAAAWLAWRARTRWTCKISMVFTAVVGLAWCAVFTEWIWMEHWRVAKFYSLSLPQWLYEPKLILWAIFFNAAVLAAMWIVWAAKLGPVRKNLVISLAFVPLWQFSVFALEEIAMSGSTEVLWLYELRLTVARLGTAGLFVIGLSWAIWFVEKASRRYALLRLRRQEDSPLRDFTELKVLCGQSVAVTRFKFSLSVAAGVALVAGAFLPFLSISHIEIYGWAVLSKIVLLASAAAAVVLTYLRWPRAIWLPVAAALAMLFWMVVESFRYLGFAAEGFFTLCLGVTLLIITALIPQEPATDSTGRVVWNPLDIEAWYYGRQSKKLVQSLTAFLIYSVYFFGAFTLFSLIGGCEERYEMPAGGGEVKQMPQMVKLQKVIKKRYVINPFSAIIFNPPPIDDKKLQLLEETQHQYKVGFGSGEGAGFSGGTAKGKVRFIRLEYAGGDWNQDFGKGADVNMLVEYHARTQHRVANNTESRTVAQLGRFALGASPPFVYLTGQRNISMSKSEIRILRKYLTDKHGMIFGDNGGSAHFHNQFFRMMRQVLPNVEPVRVPLDDPIHVRPYRIPFLPYVAPHGGKDAFGWKMDGRWVCYYHPGDIGDAWTDEHAGVKPEIAEYCYQLGVNVIFYAHVEYNKWLDARKKR